MDYKRYSRIIIRRALRSMKKGFLNVFSHIYEDSLKGYLLSWLFGILFFFIMIPPLGIFLFIYALNFEKKMILMLNSTIKSHKNLT
ncbi:MAG: hypothetical protein J0G32_03945 [Alphaproteobacteria bacterium]|nr:hypothetical protein [Alphaproteobacteria bacterium]OJV16088.1 MAG: hypothetical protein BGO27_03775 [Alphaproteobacteria bacterium 33-17]